MKLNKKVLGVAVAVALVSTSAFAVAPFGNNTQRGSLLIFPRIEVVAGVTDTLVTMVNDYGYDSVQLKCYYLAPGVDYHSKKYVKDFGKKLTPNQPIAFWASTGKNTAGTRIIPVGFSPFPPLPGGSGSVAATKGELKCWAVGVGNVPIHFNHLSGTASIITGAQAAEYTAFAFEALEPDRSTLNTGHIIAGTALGTSDAQLLLDNKMYDACPVQLLGAYDPTQTNQVTIVGCNQDLRQDRSIFETKLNYTFWDADENPVTGWYECADSWYDTYLATIEGSRIDTPIAYFRVFGGQSDVCVGTTHDSGLLGVMITNPGAANMRGTNLTGRGTYTAGSIKYNLPNNASQSQVQ